MKEQLWELLLQLVGSTIDEFGTNLATSITAASSLTNVTAAYVASSNHLKLSGSAAGTQGNVLVASSSVTTVPPAQKVFQLGVNPIGDNYTATSTGFTMTGGANSET